MSEFHFRVRAKDADSGEGSTRRPVGARMRYGGGNLHRLGLTGHLFGPTAPDLRRSRMGFGNRDGGRSTKHDLTSSRCAVVQDRRPHPPLGGKKTVPYAVIMECRSLAPLRHHQLPSWSGTRDGGGQTVTCAEGHPRRPRGRRPGRTATDRPGSRHSPPRASPCRSRG